MSNGFEFDLTKFGNQSSEVALADGIEPIEQLRERLISGWVRTQRRMAAHDGGKPASEETLRANDSFARWVEQTSERVLLKWDRETRQMYSPTQAQTQLAWIQALDSAIPVIFYLASNGGHACADHKVTSRELLSSDAYKELDAAAQWAARYAVENYQRQNPDGSWTLSNRAEE